MEPTNVSATKKDSILKSLAIAGFISILVLIAWLAIQLVHLFPGALTSLASLAEGVNGYQETIIDTTPEVSNIVVQSDNSLIDTGAEITIDWNKVPTTGTYAFTYECVEGVSLTYLTDLGERAIDCGTNYNVGDIDTLTMVIDSEKNRFADVPYTIGFLHSGDTEPRAEGGGVIAVVNTEIDSVTAAVTETVDPTPTVTAVATEEEEAESVDTTPVVSTPLPPAPVDPEPEVPFEQQFTYTIPVSDPNGTVDLSALYLGVGTITNGAYQSGTVPANGEGAIQFSVRNVGTKTSDTWTYRVALPSGSIYESDAQAPLKPNERAVITMGFPTSNELQHTFRVIVDEATDRRDSNDGFRQTVTFTQ